MKLITTIFLVFLFTKGLSQSIIGELKLIPGQRVNISLEVKSHLTQQAAGKAIDFNVNATGDHSYRISSDTTGLFTLEHQLDRVRYELDGWGKKINFDSQKETDINGPFGGPIRDLISKTYQIIIDEKGKVLFAKPESIQLVEPDSKMAAVNAALKDIFELSQPPEKNKNSLFKILPDEPVVLNQSWSDNWQNEQDSFESIYTLVDVNDSTLVVKFTTRSQITSTAEVMGNMATTVKNNKSQGTIIIRRNSGILKEKTETIESTGSTKSSYGVLPVSSKTTLKILVEPVQK